jgi:hypothetical protein
MVYLKFSLTHILKKTYSNSTNNSCCYIVHAATKCNHMTPLIFISPFSLKNLKQAEKASGFTAIGFIKFNTYTLKM